MEKMTPREIQRQRELEDKQQIKLDIEAQERKNKTTAMILESHKMTMADRKKAINKKYGAKYFTREKRPDKKDFLEINSGQIITETAGYIPMSEQVRQFERAGLHLEEQRAQLSDYGQEDQDKDGFRDLNISLYPDLISITEASRANYRRLQDAQRKAKEKNTIIREGIEFKDPGTDQNTISSKQAESGANNTGKQNQPGEIFTKKATENKG